MSNYYADVDDDEDVASAIAERDDLERQAEAAERLAQIKAETAEIQRRIAAAEGRAAAQQAIEVVEYPAGMTDAELTRAIESASTGAEVMALVAEQRAAAGGYHTHLNPESEPSDAEKQAFRERWNAAQTKEESDAMLLEWKMKYPGWN